MAIIFDAVTLVIITVTVILCIKHGFVKSFFKSLGFITAVFCALIITSSLSPVLKSAFVEDFSYNFVKNTICKNNDNRGFDDVFVDLTRSNPELCRSLEHLGVDVEGIIEYAKELNENKTEDSLELLVKKISTPMCELISDVLAFLISFGVMYLLIKLLSVLLGALVKLPFIRSVNRTLGGVYGVVLGSVRVSFFTMVSSVLYPIIGTYLPDIPVFDSVVQDTLIFGFLLRNNLVSLIINTFI